MTRQTSSATRSFAPAILIGLTCFFAPTQPIVAHSEGAEAGHSNGHDDHAGHDHDDHENDSHLSELAGFRVIHGWTNATTQNGTLVFMDLENTRSETIVLTGAEADIAAQATLVGFRLVDGEPAYETLPSVPLAAGRKMALAPNGLAIELTGLSRDLHAGDHFDIELHTSLGHVEVHIDVEPAGATQHSHAGHAH